MGEGRPTSTPSSTETHSGRADTTQGANTNLSPTLQGGPATPADRAATHEVTQENAQSGLPGGIDAQSDPARTMDNSGLLRPTGQGRDAEIMGSSGVDDTADRTD